MYLGASAGIPIPAIRTLYWKCPGVWSGSETDLRHPLPGTLLSLVIVHVSIARTCSGWSFNSACFSLCLQLNFPVIFENDDSILARTACAVAL
ncbi:uncharacterized protein BDV14DRAFT_186234 [Aspergillus stella-maris]|uniref:uncharacterized protein n=1 Tax=Aspergillus stella-maris TaxID=1810926 RepID=UPI003CCDAB7D